MAAYTTAASGNWSAAGTWTIAPPAGGPGIGDTVVFGGAHTVTIDGAAGPGANGIVKLGTGSGTCITGPSSGGVPSANLVIDNGNQLWLRGNVIDQGGGALWITVGATAGATLVFDPPNNSTQFSIAQVNYTLCVFANGTSGSHSTIKTDYTRASGSGLAGYIAAGGNGGMITATF